MPNRYVEILEESLADFGARDGAQRAQIYRQARIELLKQFEAEPGLGIERRADELALFEAAVHEVEARHAVRAAADPSPGAPPPEPVPVPEVYPSDDAPPIDVKLEAEERLYGEAEEEEDRPGFPWVRLALLVILAALGVWFVQPLAHQLDPPALYVGLAVNGLALAVLGAALFIGSRRVWLGLAGAPLLFAALTAASQRSPGLEYAFEALFEPLAAQRRAAMSFEIPALSLLPGGRRAGVTPPAGTGAEAPAPAPQDPPQNPMTATGNEGAAAMPDMASTAGESEEPAANPSETDEAAAAPLQFARLESWEPLLGDWEVECDNGPGHRFTLSAPRTTGQTDGADFARGKLTGEAFGGRSKVAFRSPLADNEIERDVEMPPHPWPANEWVYAQETVLLRAEYDSGPAEDARVFSTFFMCPIKAAHITSEDGPEGRRLAIDTECSWYAPRPPDLDAFFSGSVFAQCRFHRPEGQ